MTKKKINLLSASALGISAILGSGWLFAPYQTARIAGPASVFSWIIGATLIALLALCFAEIAALYPVRGLTAIIPTMSHNKYFGFPFAIANWLGIVAVIALEATATIQYIIAVDPNLKKYIFIEGGMTSLGTFFSIVLVVLFTLVNFWGARFFIKINNLFTVIKVLIPIVTGVFILCVSFNLSNIPLTKEGIIPYGISPIFTAIISSGIIIAFNGFQTMVSFASEIKNPGRTIPISLLIAIVFSLLVYLLLQCAFILGIPHSELANGWGGIKMYAPMLQLSVMVGLGILSPMIYFGSTLAPSGTAVAFLASSTRMFTAMSRNNQMPKFFDKVDPKLGISRRSLLINMVFAVLFLLLFKNWKTLAVILSVLHIIAYLPIPIALCVFRRHVSRDKFSFVLPFGKTIAFFLFLCFSYLFSLAGVKTLSTVLAMFFIFQCIFICLNFKGFKELNDAFKQSAWLVVYFLGVYSLSYFSFESKIALISEYHPYFIFVFASVFFFIFTRQEKNDDDLFKSAVEIYK